MKLKQIRVDGYKNLINSTIQLGDFNVIVGPNNSGKSNFLEVFPALFGIFYGHEVQTTLLDKNPFARPGSYFCNLENYKKKDLRIEIIFDTKLKNEPWTIDYSISVARREGKRKNNSDKICFNEEALKGKPPNRRGPWNVFLKRSPSTLTVATKKGLKEHHIANTISSFEFIDSIYPDLKDLGKDFKTILSGIFNVCTNNILALSPDLLRRAINEESRIVPWLRNIYFGILIEIDEIYSSEKMYKLFENTLCDILDLESVHFACEDIYAKGKNAKEKEFVKRLRSFAIKRKGEAYSSIDNYSDGTLIVIAILAALISKKRRGTMLCIEEPENYLHPRAVEKLLRFLQDHAEKWPVLITTHSPYLLNGVRPEDLNVAVVDETGAAHFEKVKNSKQLRDYLNKGLMSFGDLLEKDFAGFREK